MSRGTERRSIRIDGELWAAAQEHAGRRSDNVSEILRAALVAYVEAGELDEWVDPDPDGTAARLDAELQATS